MRRNNRKCIVSWFLILSLDVLDSVYQVESYEIATYVGQKSSNIGNFISSYWLLLRCFLFVVPVLLSLTLVNWP